MQYPAKFEPAVEGGFVVTFRDIPEAITQGDDVADATEMAEDALVTSMDFYFEGQRQVPLPSKPKRGERLISLPPSVWAKVLLLNAMIETGVRRVELAERLHTSKQEINRLVDLHHTTKIDRIGEALQAVGKRLELNVA